MIRQGAFFAAPAVLLILLPSCGGSYSYRSGDLYIFILILALIAMMVFFGIISQDKGEILEAENLETRKLLRRFHEAEDQIRLKRQKAYGAQNELLGHYDRLLPQDRKRDKRLVKAKRELLRLQKEILEAERQREKLAMEVAERR